MSAEAFPQTGQGLARYAARFSCVEVNSTFYRPHRSTTYARWLDLTPDDFRFAAKLSRAITHEARLKAAPELLGQHIAEIRQLQPKLGPLLVQLPPSLAFDAQAAETFFATLRRLFEGEVALEPRHESWFDPRAEALLVGYRVARVAADPARRPLAGRPGGWTGLTYWRLHGTPRVYYSAYDADWLGRLAGDLAASTSSSVWCLFDNTVSGAATRNALDLCELLSVRP